MPDPTPEPKQPTPPGATPEVAELTKKIAALEANAAKTAEYVEELKAESIAHRQKAKVSGTAIDNLRSALGIEGDPATVEAKVKEAVAAKDATIKQVLLEREVERAAVKAGLRKPELAGRLVDLSGVEVDLATRSVKGDLNAKFEELKKSIPELFGATPQPAPTPKPPSGTQDPGSPPPPGAGSVIEQWQKAKESGNRNEIARLWGAHALEISRYVESLRTSRP